MLLNKKLKKYKSFKLMEVTTTTDVPKTCSDLQKPNLPYGEWACSPTNNFCSFTCPAGFQKSKQDWLNNLRYHKSGVLSTRPVHSHLTLEAPTFLNVSRLHISNFMNKF